MTNTMKKSVLSIAIASCCLASVHASEGTGTNPGTGASGSIDLAFVTHLDMDMAEQDVFIEREAGSGEVFRVTNGDNDMRAPLYKTAHYVRHNPVDPKAIGPYEKGEPLGITLGQWLRHQGTGRYTCNKGQGEIETSFSGLIPNGVYTMWHAFMPAVPTEPFAGTLDLPLGNPDGSDTEFTADENGNASFVRNFKPCLQLSDTWTVSLLAINYHSDGKTYGSDPGEFGSRAHIPLFVMLPPREGL